MKHFPEALRKKLVRDQFLDDDAVFLAFMEVAPREYHRYGSFYGNYSTRSPWGDKNFRELTLGFSKRIRNDPTLMLTLVKKCGKCLKEVGDELKEELGFIRAAFEQDPLALREKSAQRVGTALLSDKSFALSLFDQVPRFPDLAVDRRFWTSVFQSEGINNDGELGNFIADHATREIKLDRALMLLACSEECEGDTIGEAFFLIPEEVQCLQTELALTALKRVRLHGSSFVELDDIALKLWSHAGVMKEFFQNSHEEAHYHPNRPEFPEAMKTNEDFGLFAARFCCYDR